MTDLFVDPSDVLLFRDGRSFSAATEDRLATGVFPPSPTVFYGALRSALLSEEEANFTSHDFGLSGPAAEVVGTQTKSGTLALTRFVLARRDENANTVQRLYPVPNDVLVCKADRGELPEDRDYTFLRSTEDPPGRTNLPEGIDLLWYQDEGVYTRAEGYLPETAFRRVLAGDLEVVGPNLLEAEELFRREPRTSVAVGEDGTAEEGVLFTVDFTRTSDEVGFALQLDGDAGVLPDTGWLRLGGEARSARYRTTGHPSRPTNPHSDMEEDLREDGRFKLVLTTPAVFEHGWRPDGIASNGTGTVAGCSVQLTGAAVDKPVPLGGWDLAKGRPKRTRRAVPAGSVYFFELHDPADAPTLADQGPVLSLSKTEVDRKQGLGLAYVGTY